MSDGAMKQERTRRIQNIGTVGVLMLSFIGYTMGDGSQWAYAPSSSSSTCGSDSNPCGPDDWYRVSSTCSADDLQSPINIDSINVEKRGDYQGPIPQATSGCNKWTQQLVNAALFQISFSASECTAIVASFEESSYSLDSMTFHTPSEHSVGGSFYSGEVQFLHTNVDDSEDQFVVSMFLQEAAYDISDSGNEFLEVLWSNGGGTASALSTTKDITLSSSSTINPYASFAPASQAQYQYIGSLTTPNCTLDVPYFIYVEPVMVSQSDLSLLRSIAVNSASSRTNSQGNNNRPIQALQGREVSLLPGGLVPTPQPSQSPISDPTYAPTESPVESHKHLRWPRPKTALVIGSVALALSSCMLVVVGILLYEILVSFGYTTKFMRWIQDQDSGSNNDDDSDGSGDDVELVAKDYNESNDAAVVVAASGGGAGSSMLLQPIKKASPQGELRRAPHLFPENAAVDVRAAQTTLLSSIVHSDVMKSAKKKDGKKSSSWFAFVDSRATEN